ncbi:4'-phosphopantetheinyl transferase superfamily protein [Corynebacterium sp. 320]|uniref:4'-phosphopantetheinyl transferase family protein n=1 Tax=Corynebacterium TaxID=1716 RepID=UPI00125CAEB6|nr:MULTISPECIES: 4'-phosphopantetheinyl transferase superfamily protein [Corynebacterium]KAB1503783.1 4'-phosphopantetheinyl transferase superfamily protein [Corynebacterium sp. 320]KAB1553117.1 4'-phosphopantetheinyl transferase superfamily protein [Corynebacterium sp. 321]KAB1553665.1 4'-phosphopantetheinyl transferase superfamily protein [Corynebacterium sp. 319]KAB3527919.1 4'-phosphopantetheinyl transferase superfamily protein [Corynebacterium sp. 250]KAB3540592.1 4'-phosphopantetheinyl t
MRRDVLLKNTLIDESLVPAGTRCVEMHTSSENLDHYLLLDEAEQELVAHAVDKRKSDFGDSRWCAHQAMRELVHDGLIMRGQRGMPVFPEGITGSLTHTEGFRAAIVGRSYQWRSLGIDAEPATHLPEGVFPAIARPEEQRRLRRLVRHHDIPVVDKVLFSAKETTYKAWFPLTRRFLDFDQADIDIRPDGTFTSYLLTRPVPVPFIQGRWAVRDGFVVTVAGVART